MTQPITPAASAFSEPVAGLLLCPPHRISGMTCGQRHRMLYGRMTSRPLAHSWSLSLVPDDHTPCAEVSLKREHRECPTSRPPGTQSGVNRAVGVQPRAEHWALKRLLAQALAGERAAIWQGGTVARCRNSRPSPSPCHEGNLDLRKRAVGCRSPRGRRVPTGLGQPCHRQQLSGHPETRPALALGGILLKPLSKDPLMLTNRRMYFSKNG